MSLKREMEQVIREAERQGWRAERTRGGHWRLSPPQGRGIVIASGTPGTRTSITKTITLLRRHGFRWRGR